MKKLTILFIPHASSTSQHLTISTIYLKIVMFASFILAGILGYVIFDYISLLQIRQNYELLIIENEELKGEAKMLLGNLEEFKKTLNKMENYTKKLNELTKFQFKKVTKNKEIKAAIGPLTQKEYEIAKNTKFFHNNNFEKQKNFISIGINFNSFKFKPIFEKLAYITNKSEVQIAELRKVLSILSQQKTILSSIPSIIPTTGWLASGFGNRISPFTGEISFHKGIDIAAPVGTPIIAPADGVVIFEGIKQGYGKFIMVAHGYGIVTAYGHNDQNLVQPGQRVSRGEQIATVGMTGRTTGPHLHYEVIVNGRNVNPSKFILQDISDDDFIAAH